MVNTLSEKFRKSRPPRHDSIIRSEIFSAERLEQHAKSLAEAHQVSLHPPRGRLLEKRLRENDLFLKDAYRKIGKAIEEASELPPAAEWLVDNYFILEEQVRDIRDDLPPQYYSQLPKLADGYLKGYPRVYGIAWAYIAHTDSFLNPDLLERFIRAYQQTQPLNIGELWAISIALRIALVENLRRATALIIEDRYARTEANLLADHLLNFVDSDAGTLEQELKCIDKATLSSAFSVQLIQRLRDQDPRVLPFLQRLDERLHQQGSSADEIVHIEHQNQGALTVTVRNIITSMRLVSTFDWVRFFESASLVDQKLRAKSNFGAMDLPTRNLYRRAIERLALRSHLSELEVAENALKAAGQKESYQKSVDLQVDITAVEREQDPGYYLIDKGSLLFEKTIGYRPTLRDKIRRMHPTVNFLVYIGATILLVISIIELGLAGTMLHKYSLWVLLALSCAAFFPAWEAAITLVNRFVTSLFAPTILPGMALRDGIPENLCTMVVVPTLLTTVEDIKAQIEQLEVHYLGNAEDGLRFALLSDWKDADSETLPQDEETLTAARAAMARLNQHHGMPDGQPRFFLFHRRRVWNPQQGKWMGWERKRGKLHEFNRLLRGASDTTFSAEPEGTFIKPPLGVRYVVTLDADTRLPRGTVKRLVGKMAHPLNHARLDTSSGYVVEGYGILQPRVASSLPHALTNSFFQRVFYSASGIDPYAFAISDVYQDLFEEGSFAGKGIYDVDAVERAVSGRIPDNTVLSHDLLEGIFARAGLASDVEVMEEFPSRYDVASSRQHRWARGDWQLLPWIFGKVSDNVPVLGHWKMVDNLRRTFTAPFGFVALLIGWSFPIGTASLWTALIVSALSMPLLLRFFEDSLPRPGASKSSHVLAVCKDAIRTSEQIALMMTFMAHQAWLMIDAIFRTLWRLAVSHRNLLEWVSAAEVKVSQQRDIAGFYIYMSGSILLTMLAIICLMLAKSTIGLVALPFLILWLLAPTIAQIASRPGLSLRRRPLDYEEKKQFRLIGRATWRFFDRFVTAAENHLPPDNFQEDPVPVIAHRTSPTNIGLYLLSVTSAQDFGWIGITETLTRFGATLDTLSQMERHRGHFYNWYNTTSLQPLLPRYISSVDSGNLAGYLIVLKQVCCSASALPILNTYWLIGLDDVVDLTQRALEKISQDLEGATRRHLNDSLSAIKTAIGRARVSAPTMQNNYLALREIEVLTETILDLTSTFHAEMGNKVNTLEADVMRWGRELHAAAQGNQRDLKRFAPWLAIILDAPKVYDNLPPALFNLLTTRVPTLGEVPDLCLEAESLMEVYAAQAVDGAQDRMVSVLRALKEGSLAARADSEQFLVQAQIALRLFSEMDFTFLLDMTRQLLSIGYRVEDNALDSSHYDLLASEARLASVVAIAKGDISAHNWFRLGRTLTSVNSRPALVSWSGSMFEYLMPSLVVREPDESLIGQTNRMVVRRQIEYGDERGVPWGVSESAYNARDFEFTYQYSSFGIPGLGLKRGLSENIVVTPYATALAAMIDPQAALKNMQRMEEMGGRGMYGWYEAFDFTSKRLPDDEGLAIVHAYMAHHQGMTLVAILNVLQDGRMRDRFHAEPIIQATELLLQELPPRKVVMAHPRSEEVEAIAHIREIIPPNPRCFKTPDSAMPRTHLLSNGEYAVMVTAAGSGYSHWRNLALTRWREDSTRDSWGSFIYLRDAQNGKIWSASYQPVCAEPDSYNVAFFEDHAEFFRRDGGLATTLNVVVSSEDHGEVRRVSIVNHGDEARDVELTSYAELVLTQQATDVAHPAFAKLFVQTEFVPEAGALLATRRSRSPEEKPIWAVHLVSVGGDMIGNLQFETDRARFLGRGRTPRNPQAVDGRPLNDTAGTVLDPIFSLRCRVRIAPGTTAHIAFWTLVASSREEALSLADKYRAPSAYNRAAARAWTQAQLQYQHLSMTPGEAHLFQRLANHVLYADRALRPNSETLKGGAGAQSVLWSTGISGDVPIVLMRIDVASDLKTLRQMVRAHSYWSIKRLEVDLVILNEQPTSYLEDLQNEIELLVRTSQALPRASSEGAKGGIFVLRGDQISREARALLHTVARAVIVGHRGSLAEQLAFQLRDETVPFIPQRRRFLPKSPIRPKDSQALEFFNGIGGFANQGREYVTILEPGQLTPAPWVNIIANQQFGFQVSSEGAGYSWAVNSRDYQLTPWSNDPISDEAGEIIYLRDVENGTIWTPTATPIRKDGMTYIARHGFGYSEFENNCYGIEAILTQFVPLQDSVKISRLKIRNTSNLWRRISISSYTEWVLGQSRTSAAPFLITEMDMESNAMLVRNPWSNEFGTRVAFVHMSGQGISWTGDRREFIGRNGALHNPVALTSGATLSGKVGAGFDPCTVLQRLVELKPGQEIEIVILLGDAATATEVKTLLQTYQKVDLEQVLREVKSYWNDALGQIQVHTPDRAMDIMQNGWLLYQTIVCRIWARSGFYQASGAYGYRDQLQDTMALVFHQPAWTRQHLLRAAGRQFPEGDVQHWWLPSKTDAGRGIRTRFSDDPLWLVYVTAYYVKVTGDSGILDEEVLFLQGPVLKENEDENFFLPYRSEQTATLYEHCVLAIEQRLKIGSHGLSLFGGGDWNDGMNRVGSKGQGESVWLSWFLLSVIKNFAQCAKPADVARVANWQRHASDLKSSLEREAWDGEWYRRGYYDDGTPLGSASSTECRIDSIAQSWAVISGEGEVERVVRAMKAVKQYLIKEDDGLALLLTPPFDHTPLDPGYIKGYPPGIRENGGQYTHAALWSVIAFTQLGDGDSAFALLSMLNPIHHASSRAGSYRYKVEPYVVAADIYSNPQHIGRGGWTWYTGSAGWMYRAGLESILGFCLEGSSLRINPSIPKNWPGFEMSYRYKSTTYLIMVNNERGVNCGVVEVELDGKSLGAAVMVPLIDDGGKHIMRVVMGVS